MKSKNLYNVKVVSYDIAILTAEGFEFIKTKEI